MIQVNSLGNDRVRRVLALQRSTRRRLREGLLVAEGVRLLGELAASTVEAVEVFVTHSFVKSGSEAEDLVARLRVGATLIEVSDEVMAEIAGTLTPQGVLAVLPIPSLRPRRSDRFLLIPDQVRDPGNLGTMLRTAWAAEVTQVLLPPGTVDYTNPKVVRAGMGAHFHLPITPMAWDSIGETAGPARIRVAEAGRGRPYDQVDWRDETALVIGGEAAGPSVQARGMGEFVHIPMADAAESLNAAVAAGILLFEAARQRRQATGLSPLPDKAPPG